MENLLSYPIKFLVPGLFSIKLKLTNNNYWTSWHKNVFLFSLLKIPMFPFWRPRDCYICNIVISYEKYAKSLSNLLQSKVVHFLSSVWFRNIYCRINNGFVQFLFWYRCNSVSVLLLIFLWHCYFFNLSSLVPSILLRKHQDVCPEKKRFIHFNFTSGFTWLQHEGSSGILRQSFDFSNSLDRWVKENSVEKCINLFHLCRNISAPSVLFIS